MSHAVNSRYHLDNNRQQFVPEVKAINQTSSFFEMPSTDPHNSKGSVCNGPIQSLENSTATSPIVAKSLEYPQNFPNDIV
jgi:hypothetical protein